MLPKQCQQHVTASVPQRAGPPVPPHLPMGVASKKANGAAISAPSMELCSSRLARYDLYGRTRYGTVRQQR